MSLRTKLQEYISANGYVDYNDLKSKVENGYFGRFYRITTAERRLRSSESPTIEPVMNGNHIKGYKLRENATPIVSEYKPMSGEEILRRSMGAAK